MRNIRKCPSDTESRGLTCKEKGCQGRIPTGKSLISWHCQMLGICRYCYRMKFPKRKRYGPPLRQGSERLLSWSDRRRRERYGFNPILWSSPFRKQVLDYWKAKERGEVR